MDQTNTNAERRAYKTTGRADADYDYVNNKAFYEMICDYQEACKRNEEEGKPIKEVPANIGENIERIIRRMGNKFCYARYSYLDEMKQEARIDCYFSVLKFKPEKSTNPFAYFYQITKTAFNRRIWLEKKQSYVRQRLIQEVNFDELYDSGDPDIDHSFLDELRANVNPDLEKLFGKDANKHKVNVNHDATVEEEELDMADGGKFNGFK